MDTLSKLLSYELTSWLEEWYTLLVKKLQQQAICIIQQSNSWDKTRNSISPPFFSSGIQSYLVHVFQAHT